jgi:pyridinium-3,5-biscarboxylic acid mononucleotide sulfurtransferase
MDHTPDDARERTLRQWFRDAGTVAIGYSGGVDSTYLALVARQELGPGRMLAVVGRSASYPDAQWATARDTAAAFDLPLLEIDTGELDDPRYAANPDNRCYFCKSELWSRVVPVAHARGLTTVVDGTNADDLGDHRPGMQAARELGVRSPLAELGFTKAEIRERSRVHGLPTWAAPAAPCLSSRIPYGTPVTRERLRRIEVAEAGLRALGVQGDLRVRDHGDLARVELSPAELDRWMTPGAAAQLVAAVRPAGFPRVVIDLRGFRSGSLNVLHGVTA